jgi:energy-coupling factor transport system permease protein
VLKNFSLGIYYPGDSFVHRLQARTKLLVLLWLFVVLAIANHRPGHLAPHFVVVALALISAWLSGVSLGHLWQRVRFLTFVEFSIVIGLLLFPDGQPLFLLGPIMVTRESVWLFVSISVILVALYVLSLLLTMTTTPVALIEGLTLLIAPLRRLRLPVDDFALMTLLALRFIPTLVDEAEQLIQAQLARGADLSRGALLERARSLAALFVPLIHAVLRRAAELATALEARGYAAAGQQTMLNETVLGREDYLALGVVVVVTIGSLVV